MCLDVAFSEWEVQTEHLWTQVACVTFMALVASSNTWLMVALWQSTHVCSAMLAGQHLKLHHHTDWLR